MPMKMVSRSVPGLLLALALGAAPLPPATLASWPFSEGFGSTTADITGNGYTGSIVGSPAWVNGLSGKALAFNNPFDYVQIPPLPMAGDWTVQAWTLFPLNNTIGGYPTPG